MLLNQVIVLKSPISDRMVSAGAVATMDTEKSSIRVGGNWFNFDNRWQVVPEEEVNSKKWYGVQFVCNNGHNSTFTSIPAAALKDPLGYLKKEGYEGVRDFEFKN